MSGTTSEFSRLDVTIHPIALEELQKTSTAEEWAALRADEKMPEEGWLKDGLGRIHYHSDGEYYDRSILSASLFLSQEKFDDLVRAIKAGGIRSARLQILADLFQFGWEGLVADISGHTFNYAILCEDEGDSAWGIPKGASGWTRARLQEVLLEWSPPLESKTGISRDEPDDLDFLEPGMESEERDVEKVVVRLARDVQSIRAKVDVFYQAAIVGVIILVVIQVFDWIGF